MDCSKRRYKASEPQLITVGTTVETPEVIMVANHTLHEHSQKVRFLGNQNHGKKIIIATPIVSWVTCRRYGLL